MSTRDAICNLVNDKVPASDLDLLYQLVLKFIPADLPTADELAALEESRQETEFFAHDEIDWEHLEKYLDD